MGGDDPVARETRINLNRQNATPEEIDGALRDLEVSVPAHAKLPPEDQRRLRLWVNNVVKPIEWYDGRVAELERERRVKNHVALLAVVAGIAVMGWLYLKAPGGAAGLSVFQVSLALTVALAALDSLTEASALKERYALFQKARADLRTLLYDLADRWAVVDEAHGCTAREGDAERLSDRFREAVDACTLAAKVVVRAEQEQYFATLRFPSDITNLLFSRALTNVRARASESPLVARAGESVTRWREAARREQEARRALEDARRQPDLTAERRAELERALDAAARERESAERQVDALALLSGSPGG